FCCIGTGDSALTNLGLGPATLAQLEEYVAAVRGLLSVGKANYLGDELSMRPASLPVPILVAGNGPKTLRLAGRIADGVLLGGSLAPEVVARLASHVTEGHDPAGRTRDEIDIWYLGRAAIAGSSEDAVAKAGASLAGSGAHIFRDTMDGK